MKIAILSQNPNLYSTKRLVEAGTAKGHKNNSKNPISFQEAQLGKKTTGGECSLFHVWSKKRLQKKQGANQNMALGVEHVYQLWKKAQETAATGL